MNLHISKTIIMLLMLCLCAVSLSACGSGKTENKEKGTDKAADVSVTETAQPTESAAGTAERMYPDAPKIDTEYPYTQDMSIVERSLLSCGNKERLQNVLDKAASGEALTVAFIGGSITYGYKVAKNECFATLLCNRIKDVFGVEVNCINAGISGTPSVLGNLRVERDVLEYDPDLVFVEFAVNDGFDDEYKNSYESLINKILAYESDPAVVLLFTITRDGHTCQPWMSEIGEYYKLPMVSVPDSVWAEVQAGIISYDDYSSDETHPNKQGHKWITELLYYCLETVYNSDFETEHYVIPEDAYYKNYYKDMKLYTNESLAEVNVGASWKAAETMPDFPDGWAYIPDSGNEAFTFTADCRAIIILYHEMPKTGEDSWGAVDVFVDDEKVQSIYACSSSGWNNPTYNITYESVTSAEHTISIKAKEGFEDKNFEILGIAYMK